MLRLAVTSSSETFDRLRTTLSDRDVEVVFVQARERTLSVTGTPDLPDVDVGLVYPTRLMEGAAVDAHLSVPWVNGRDDILTSRNKAGVLAALSRADVPVPETVLVSNPVDEADVLAAVDEAGLSFPLVVKPNSATRGVGIAKVDEPDSLLGVVDYLDLVHDYRATGDKSYLLQEFLPDARDYRAMVVDGTCYGGVERRLPDAAGADGRFKHNVHRGAEAVGVDLLPTHRRLAERVSDVLDVPYLGVDLLETEGRLVVSETNARPTVDEVAKYDDGFTDALVGLIERTAGRHG